MDPVGSTEVELNHDDKHETTQYLASAASLVE